jgi:hypothetical protein
VGDRHGVVGVNDGVNWDRKAAFVQAEIAKAYREAARQDENARTMPKPVEDDEGYVADNGNLVKGPTWQVPLNDAWRDGPPLYWLHGDAS